MGEACMDIRGMDIDSNEGLRAQPAGETGVHGDAYRGVASIATT